MDAIVALDRKLKTVCPIDGVRARDAQDITTYEIDFAHDATDAQKRAARDLLAVFDLKAEQEALDARAALAASDRDLPRVFEDLVDLLAAKGIIALDEFPQTAREKLAARTALRDKI